MRTLLLLTTLGLFLTACKTEQTTTTSADSSTGTRESGIDASDGVVAGSSSSGNRRWTSR